MKVSNGWSFLTYWGMMDRLGLSISCLHMIFGETEGPAPIQTGVVNLGGVLMVFPYHGIVLSVSLHFTTVWSFKSHASMYATLVTISFKIIVRHACKVPPLAATPSSVIWLISGMTTGKISRMSRLINSLCGEFSVVNVSISDFYFISVTSVSINHWISVWIAFYVIFLWIIIWRIVDCWLNSQSYKSLYRFCQDVQINSPLLWNVCNVSLCIGCDRRLNEIRVDLFLS